MQQPDSLVQLAQSTTNFLEPLFPYIIIGTKQAAEEAGKKAGLDVWERGKNIWEKLCSKENPKLEKTAEDIALSPSDTEAKQAFIQEIVKSLRKDPDLTKEIKTMMKDGIIQRVIAKNGSVIENVKQNSSVTNKVCQEVIADGSTIKGVEQTQNARYEKNYSGSENYSYKRISY
jgi:hypothetical protein